MRFADLTQLEKVFPSSSKIRAIYAFVRESLREDVKPIKFVLCASLWNICAPDLTCIHLSRPGTHTPCPPEPTASNPPPRELKVSDPAVRDLTLAELGLAPSSVLHLRFVDDELNRASLFFPSRFPGFPLLYGERRHAYNPSLHPPKKRSGLIYWSTDFLFSLNVTRFGRACSPCVGGPGTCRRSSCTPRLRWKTEKGRSTVAYRIGF